MSALTSKIKAWGRWFLRLMLAVCAAVVVLQGFFAARVAGMRWVDPVSTTFERSEWTQIWVFGNFEHAKKRQWRQNWRGYDAIAPVMKQAVIASEDARFTDHDGVEWEAMERAWEKNQAAEQKQKAREAEAERLHKAQQKKAQQRKAQQSGSLSDPSQQALAASNSAAKPATKNTAKPAAKVVGGSTITQQLAKNLLLSGERTFLRKVQELVLTFWLELFLDKTRILELYLNHVELGTGVFGVGAASLHYYSKEAKNLSPQEAAKLAVMLPRPKFLAARFHSSGYLNARAQTVVSRMSQVDVPE